MKILDISAGTIPAFKSHNVGNRATDFPVNVEIKMNLFYKAEIILIMLFFVFNCATPKGNNKQEKVNDRIKMKNDTLNELFKNKLEVKLKIQRAAGSAVFSNISTNLFLFSSGNGYGVTIDGSAGKKTYMKMNFLGNWARDRYQGFSFCLCI